MNYLTVIQFRSFDQDALEMRITEAPMSESDIMNVVCENTRTAYLTANVVQYALSDKKEIEIAHIEINKSIQNKFRKYLGN